jgi:transcriptional regulator with XRE-family HTH domain
MQKIKITRRKRERLGEFVRRIRNEKGLSLIDVSKHSALFGPPISGSYINRIERNPKLKVTPDRLKALAHGLRVPVQEIFAHAVKTMSRDEADVVSLVTRYRELSPKRQSDVFNLIQCWHSEHSSQRANPVLTDDAELMKQRTPDEVST